jgi:O-antigen/teichoic acid export membrane protein
MRSILTEKQSSIVSKFIWTVGAFGASLVIRFSTSIVQARLLGPEIMGIVVIVQAIRTGTDLLTDIGMEQNVVNSQHGDDPAFLNTVWTMQIMRGALVSLATAALSFALADFYGVPLEALLVVSLAPLIASLSSTSIMSLTRRLKVKQRSLFDLSTDAIALAINIGLALVMPTVWAPVLGILLGLVARSVLSYLLWHPPHRLMLDRSHAAAILGFGKWIMLSSLALYASLYLDRLFLGWAIDIALLGVYGLARTVSMLPVQLAGRLGYQIIYPVIAADREGSNLAARRELGSSRLRFLLLGAAGIGTVMASADWAVLVLYGHAFYEAGWMLFLLLCGSWIAVLASMGEAAVLGVGRPKVASLGNIVRIATMAIALPSGFAAAGLPGAIIGLGVGELARYGILASVQRQAGRSMLGQDALVTVAMVGVLAVLCLLRITLGLGLPWDALTP